MTKLESRARCFLQRHLGVLALSILFLAGLYVRYKLLSFPSPDILTYNVGWLRAIRRNGLAAQIELGYFNYSPLFAYLFTLLCKLFSSVDEFLLSKLIAISMEMFTSIVCFVGTRALCSQKRAVSSSDAIMFCFFWLNPILLLNGSAWGQLDTYYALFSLIAVFLAMRQRPGWAVIFLGIALCWKLQAIFLLPLFVFLYLFGQKRFCLLWFLAIPAIMLLSSLPMMRYNESPLYIFSLYATQTDDHWMRLVLNYPNIYVLLGVDLDGATAYGLFAPLFIAMLGVVFVGAACRLRSQNAAISPDGIPLLAAWCVLICTFFLPKMHDRYGFVGELLLLCCVFLYKRRGLLICTVLCYAATFNAYVRYLVNATTELQISALLQFVALLLLSYECFFASNTDGEHMGLVACPAQE